MDDSKEVAGPMAQGGCPHTLAATLKAHHYLAQKLFCSWALTNFPWLCLRSGVELRFTVLTAVEVPKDPVFSTKSVCYSSTEASLASPADPEVCQLPSGSAVRSNGGCSDGGQDKKALGAEHWPGWGRKKSLFEGTLTKAGSCWCARFSPEAVALGQRQGAVQEQQQNRA